MNSELYLEEVIGDKVFKIWLRRYQGKLQAITVKVAMVVNKYGEHGPFSIAVAVGISPSGKYKMKGHGSWTYTPGQFKFILGNIQDLVDTL